MRNVKAILVLLLFGFALMFVGATRMSLSDSAGQVGVPASATVSWITGMLGVVLLAADATLLGKRAAQARSRAATGSATRTLTSTRTMAIVGGAIAAVAVVAIGSSMLRSQASPSGVSTPTQSHAPVARDGSTPAPTPDMPTPYSPK